MITHADGDWIEESESRQPRLIVTTGTDEDREVVNFSSYADECRRLKKKLVSVKQSIPGEIIAMNCSNCGAPLSSSVHQRSLLCGIADPIGTSQTIWSAMRASLTSSIRRPRLPDLSRPSRVDGGGTDRTLSAVLWTAPPGDLFRESSTVDALLQCG
ncbi:MAG: hypothetical protein R3B91_14235 [Planctomycetaceae bacterium]